MKITYDPDKTCVTKLVVERLHEEKLPVGFTIQRMLNILFP